MWLKISHFGAEGLYRTRGRTLSQSVSRGGKGAHRPPGGRGVQGRSAGGGRSAGVCVNGGGVGWGEVINGGFGMLLDGSNQSKKNIENMLYWDVNNGIARRSWARNKGAINTIKQAMKENPLLDVTLPKIVDDNLINSLKEKN